VPYGDVKDRSPVERRFPCSREVVALATEVAHLSGLPTHAGRYVTVPRILFRAAETRVVAERTGAIAADMESAAICAEGESRGIPVLVARTVSDLLDEDLPLDFNLFLGPAGWARGIMHTLAHPASLGGLNRMRVQGKIAAERLTQFFCRFLIAVDA